MKILLVGRARMASFGGVQSFVRDLMAYLVRSGSQVEYAEIPRDGPGPVTRYTCQADHAVVAACAYAPDIRCVLMAARPDAVHSHNMHTCPLGTAIEIEDLTAAMGIPHLLTVHDITVSSEAHDVLRALKRTILCTQSAYNREQLFRILGRVVATLPVGIDFGVFGTEQLPDPKTIACPGRLAPGKGVDIAVQILGRLASDCDRLRVVLSDPTLHSFGQSATFLRHLESEAALCPRLTLEYNTGGPRQLYRKSQCTLMFPVMPEGFGMSALECLAMGRPVIGHPTGAMGDWLKQLPGVVLLPGPTTLAEVREVLRSILDNWDDWHRRALEARDILERSYSMKVSGDLHLRFYEAAIGV